MIKSKKNSINSVIKFKNIIMFPHRDGQKKIGVEKTPKILHHLISPKIKIHYTKTKSNELFNNLQNLFDKNRSIKGPRINIGGDHSMAISTVADSLLRYPKLKVICQVILLFMVKIEIIIF